MRFFISADIEGIHGVTSIDQLFPKEFEYELARDWMTDSVVAVVEVLQAAGATEVVVADSHNNGENIKLDRLPDCVQLLRSWPRPLGMAEGVDLGHFDGAILLGYHASASAQRGAQKHTMTPEWQEVRVNGKAVSEAYLTAAIAGEFGVPVILCSGDDAAVEEAASQLGPLPGVVTKWAYGFNSVRTLTPNVALDRLREGTRQALAWMPQAKPLKLGGPLELEIRFASPTTAEALQLLKAFKRLDAYTVAYQADDMIELSKLLMFLALVQASLCL